MTVNRVNAGEMMRAKQVDLLSYLEAKGEKFKKEGNYYRHMEHDSLIIRDNMYAWNSKGLKGHGAINFAKDFYGLSFVEAVRELSSGNYPTINREKQQEVKQTQEFQYPEFLEVKDHTTIKRYLVHERKIDSRIVDWLIRKDLIAQDQKNNVVFKWRENGGKGQIVGAERQGTVKIANKRGSFKQILSNSKKHVGFTVDIGRPNKIYYFESPVDLLSYWSIKKERLTNARLVSMNGLKDKTVLQSYMEAKKQGHAIKQVILAVDNDLAGKEFVGRLKKVINPKMFDTDLPAHEKDWNDELKGSQAKKSMKVKQHAVEQNI
ncbi:DUF3991 and TOPRIM domain-containing protein [Bacillus sp. OTU530]|uniref:DUF3991 and TOPRIM domain-containing protein n=1 Tax=Bacillus sp. OTU530 TaxID=3043862 RepID=UPI00313B856C